MSNQYIYRPLVVFCALHTSVYAAEIDFESFSVEQGETGVGPTAAGE